MQNFKFLIPKTKKVQAKIYPLKVVIPGLGLELFFDVNYFQFYYFSEGRPSRGDMSVLVAHNDDPTGMFI